MARPKLQIDEKVVEGFAKIGATDQEIADYFNCHKSVIGRRFATILTKARAGRKFRLRQLQWQLAEKGNLGMLIWLGKQELGQAEKLEQEGTIKYTLDKKTREELSNLPDREVFEHYKKKMEE